MRTVIGFERKEKTKDGKEVTIYRRRFITDEEYEAARERVKAVAMKQITEPGNVDQGTEQNRGDGQTVNL
jgi:hypothetical protein